MIVVVVFQNLQYKSAPAQKRFDFSQLGKMGASIETAGNKANIKGNAKLRGCQVMATDLRAGAALVLAGLVAEGTTEISEIYHIERGYEKFIEKFESLGAKITRVDD